MELHQLSPAPASTKTSKRIGRGQGSGKGGTATKGHKGAQSRSGYKRKYHLSSGQTPLQRRLPKFGFKNPNKRSYRALNLTTLQQLATKTKATHIDAALLHKHGLISKRQHYKILGVGTLEAPLTVHAHALSASAKAAIEKAKGSFKLL